MSELDPFDEQLSQLHLENPPEDPDLVFEDPALPYEPVAVAQG